MLVQFLAAAALSSAPLQRDPAAPHWLERPGGDDIVRVYPERAQRAEISGEAELDCRVAASGRLEQ